MIGPMKSAHSDSSREPSPLDNRLLAALPAVDVDGGRYELHLSTRLSGGLWTVELRRPGAKASLGYDGGSPTPASPATPGDDDTVA
jgi:hypothetical protein